MAASGSKKPVSTWLERAALIGGFGYVATLLAACFWLRWLGERHWSGTLLEFGPRWILLCPIVGLGLAAMWLNWRMWGFVFVALAIGLWLTGWNGAGLMAADLETDDFVRVLSLNTDSQADPQLVHTLVNESSPQVLLLQECRPNLWQPEFEEWNVEQLGEFVIASRFPISALEPISSSTGSRMIGVSCRLTLPSGKVATVINVHLTSPRPGLDAVLHEGWRGISLLESQRVQRRQESELISNNAAQLERPLILGGDFNQTADTSAWSDCWGDYQDAFCAAGVGWGTTFHTRRHALRIDHILASREWSVNSCWVGPDVESAHRPLIATLCLSRSTERDL